jgi:hypothetical protein
MEERAVKWLNGLELYIERGWQHGEAQESDHQIRLWLRSWRNLAQLARHYPDVTFSAIQDYVRVDIEIWIWTFFAMLEGWMFKGEKELHLARRVLTSFLKTMDDTARPELGAMARGILGLNLQWSEGFFAADAYYRHAVKVAPGHGSIWLRWSMLHRDAVDGEKQARVILRRGLAQLDDPIEQRLLMTAIQDLSHP